MSHRHCCVDGLTGFEEAIQIVFPPTLVQLCTVHPPASAGRGPGQPALRQLERLQGRRGIAPNGLRRADAGRGRAALAAFGETWDTLYPMVRPAWERHWDALSVFFAFRAARPPRRGGIRRVLYTTNSTESLNRGLRKVLKTRGSLPSDGAVTKLLYLAVTRLSERWTRPIQNWPQALNHFALHFEGRVPLP